MWCYVRGNSGGSWLPEEKKANVWHGRGNSGGSWPPAFPRSLCKANRTVRQMNDPLLRKFMYWVKNNSTISVYSVNNMLVLSVYFLVDMLVLAV